MDRSRLYKNSGKDSEALRRRRVDQSVELRKAKKDEQLQKRRNVLIDVLETSPLREVPLKHTEAIDYSKVISEMESSDENVRYNAIQMCRKTLSVAKNPPIEDFFERGAVKALARSLDSSNGDLLFEAAWALTNIASGESRYTKGVVDSGASSKFIFLLEHNDIRVAEQCAWALGNIAGDGPHYRDMLINLGVVDPVLRLLDRTWNRESVVSNIAWLLSNLCRNKNPIPPRKTVLQLLSVFRRLLEYPHSQEVIIDTTWALSYVSDNAIEFIGDILKSGCLPILLELLASNATNLTHPALRAVGNLILGSDAETQTIIDGGVMRYVPGLLSSDRPAIVKETCWMLSNITAGNENQIQTVINAGLVPQIIGLLQSGEFKVQKEACWVISNMVKGGSPDQQVYLLEHNILEPLSRLLAVSDSRVLKLVMETFRKIFETAEQLGQLEKRCLDLEVCGGLNYIEKLQDHNNEDVYRIAYDFIAQFFNDAEEHSETDEAIANDQQPTPTPVVPHQESNEFRFLPQLQSNQSNFDF